jgi:tRNA-dihydrouridine synthase 3
LFVQLCPTILNEKECRFGDKCKFCHDVSAFVKDKPEDIGPVCHNFVTFGRCPYGIACRYGKDHISEDLKNITNQELFDRVASQPSQFHNTINKDVQSLLWKKKYDFSKADTIVNSYYDHLRKQQAQVGSSGDQSTNGDYVKPLGSVTDEGEIKLLPREKKLVCSLSLSLSLSLASSVFFLHLLVI